MAYSTGMASSMADLLTALVTAATGQGWAWADSILSSGDCFVRLTSATAAIEALAGLGKSGATITTPAPASTYLQHPLSSAPIAFPVTYHIFAHPTEAYLMVRYATDKFTLLAFGQSSVDGASGRGVWVSGTGGVSPNAFYWQNASDATIDLLSGYARTGLFLVAGTQMAGGQYVYHGMTGWSGDTSVTVASSAGGVRQLTALDSPSTSWNGQAFLCPIQPLLDRGSSKVSVIADLKHARHVRIDNLEPGDTITLGSDQWVVFPVYKKDSSARSPQGSVSHSGTHGYAFRV